MTDVLSTLKETKAQDQSPGFRFTGLYTSTELMDKAVDE
jgi:hypothetical protein